MSLIIKRNRAIKGLPESLGLPARFTDWRPGQQDAIEFLVRQEPRFHLLNAPTGAGKSLSYAALAQKLAPARVLVLTSTRGLMDQVSSDFSQAGWFDVRGASNYPCIALDHGGEHQGFYGGRPGRCDEGPCHFGAACSLRNKGCSYYDRVADAAKARVVVTNYSFLFHSYFYGAGIGDWGAIVLDEAHEAPDELSSFLTVELAEDEIGPWLRWPTDRDQAAWRLWATEAGGVIAGEIDSLGHDADRSTLKRLKKIGQKLARVATMTGDWVWYERRWEDRGVANLAWRWGPLWPAPYAEDFLFRHTPRVVLTSATARPKTMELLGVEAGEFDTFESTSSFPVENRLVTVLAGRGYVPQVRYGWSEPDQALWVERHDEVIASRLHLKGLIHTGSYQRSKLLRERSRFASNMYVPWSGNTAEKVAAFKRAKPPAILVSPAIHTGYDFPGDEARWQIISKVPFPDTSDPVVTARQKADSEYGSYLAAVAMVQAAGRIVRGPDDWGETFTADANFGWFLKKNAGLFPSWFLDSVVYSYDSTPGPRR